MKTLLRNLAERYKRFIEADPRYVCAACDDRFPSVETGIAHVERCHPEFRGVVVYDPAVGTKPALAHSH